MQCEGNVGQGRKRGDEWLKWKRGDVGKKAGCEAKERRGRSDN